MRKTGFGKLLSLLPYCALALLFVFFAAGVLHLPEFEKKNPEGFEVYTETTPAPAETSAEKEPAVSGEKLEVYFLDVGQADGAVIRCGEHAMLIDGGNVSDSRFLYSFLRKTLKLRRLDAVIATHPHEDHIGAIAAALNACTADAVYSPVTEAPDCPAFPDFLKYVKKQGLTLTVPRPGDSFLLGGAEVTFLAPVQTDENVNNLSLMVRISLGKISFLFTGDAEEAEERDAAALRRNIRSTVLKVSHHGSDTSSCEEFLSAVRPEIAVISVGTDNPYGHPDAAVLQRLSQYTDTILRTDQCGMIVMETDGTDLSVYTEKRPPDTTAVPAVSAATEASAAPAETAVPHASAPVQTEEGYPYIGNSNSMKFHTAACGSVADMSEKNKVPFETREDAVAAGYKPCKRCNP